MPRARGGEDLRAGELEAHRAPRREGERRGERLGDDVLLGAEPAAYARLDDPDPLDRQVEGARHDAADVERHLRGGDDDEAVVGIEVADADVRLVGDVLRVVVLVFVFNDEIRLREARGHVADGDVGPSAEVLLRVHLDRDGDEPFRLVVDDRGALLHRVARVENRGERLVVDLDEPERRLRDRRRLRRDHGDLVADEADLAVEDELVVGGRLRAPLPRLGDDDARDVLPGEDRLHPGEAARPRGVDGPDAGVRMRAPQHLGREHPGQVVVVREEGPPGDEPDAVHAAAVLVDLVEVPLPAHRRAPRRRAPPFPAASRLAASFTAFTIFTYPVQRQ